MTVETKDVVCIGLAKNDVFDHWTFPYAVREIAVVGDDFVQLLQVLSGRAVGMIVNHKDFRLLGYLGVIESDCLHSEIDTVVIIIGGHAYGHHLFRTGRSGLGNFRWAKLQADCFVLASGHCRLKLKRGEQLRELIFGGICFSNIGKRWAKPLKLRIVAIV